MLRALCALPGGLGRFLPCAIGANHRRLRHIGWDKSGQGLTSRPRETSNVRFLDELLFLFGYPPGSGVALLRTTRFAHKVLTWSLPAPGGVALLDLGFREFDLGEKPQFMRFFGGLLGITLGHEFGRD